MVVRGLRNREAAGSNPVGVEAAAGLRKVSGVTSADGVLPLTFASGGSERPVAVAAGRGDLVRDAAVGAELAPLQTQLVRGLLGLLLHRTPVDRSDGQIVVLRKGA